MVLIADFGVEFKRIPQSAIRNPQSSGFTLIETVLAISIFAMVVAVIFSSFRVGIQSWEKGERDIAFFQSLRAVSELLYREINSTYPYKITPGQLDRHKEFMAFFGKSDSLKFVSYANLHKRSGGLSLIELWVEDDRGLMIGEGPALASNYSEIDDMDLRDEDRAVAIFPEVEKIKFRYFERKKRDDDGDWQERWDPRDKKSMLPLFVEITLSLDEDTFDASSKRLIVPIMYTGKKI